MSGTTGDFIEIRFGIGGNSEQYILSGWGVPEPNGSWSIGGESRLRVSGIRSNTGYRLTANLAPYLNGPRLPYQALSITVNGTLVWSQRLVTRAAIECQIPPNIVGTSGGLEVVFHSPNAVAPKTFGNSDDVRALGFSFWNLTLTAATAIPTTPVQSPLFSIPTAARPPETTVPSSVPARPAGSTLTIGICAVVRDEAPYLEEWIEFHRLQGVSAWSVYDNGSSDETPLVLRRLGIEPVNLPDRPISFEQQRCQAYLEGGRALAEQVEWVAWIDADEFLFGSEGKTLAESLGAFASDVGAVAVQQALFGSNGHKTASEQPVTVRFTRCARHDHPENRYFKTIARPRLVERHKNAGSVVLRAGRYVMVDGSPLERETGDDSSAAHRVEGPIHLHHYCLKSREEFARKISKWSDRQEARLRRAEDFDRREQYANLEERRYAVDVMAPALRVAAVTMVYDEPEFLPIWLRHYGGQIGAEHCYVLDHGSDDGSTDALGGATRIRIPRSEFDEFRRAAAISKLCASLLQWYHFVIHTDVDEIVVADPAVARSLRDYCTGDRAPVTTAIGLNLVHRMGSEGPLDPSRPILEQRTTALSSSSLCKPVLIRQPVDWSIGFHSYNGPVHFDDLYLFHLAIVDFRMTMTRQEKRRRVAAGNPFATSAHRQPDSQLRALMEEWAVKPIEPFETAGAMLAAFRQQVVSSQAGRERERFRISLDVFGNKLWPIPKRFLGAF